MSENYNRNNILESSAKNVKVENKNIDNFNEFDELENIDNFNLDDEILEELNELNDEMLGELDGFDDEILEGLDELDDEEYEKRKKHKIDIDENEATMYSVSLNNPNEKRDLSGPAVRQRFYKIMENYHSGDPQKKQDAIEQAMRELEGFIHSIIKRSYSTYTKEYFYDLLQEGYLGVIVGLEKYNPDISMPSTFFFPYIKHEMQGLITRNVDKTTSHYSSNIKKINKAIELFEERGQKYSNVDIAIQTGMTVETVDQSMAIRNYRDEIHIDGCKVNVIDEQKTNDAFKSPEDAFLEKEQNSVIYKTINKILSKDEIAVLEMHFGINDKEVLSEGEIAKRMSIPKDRVKRLLNGSIRKLKESELSLLFNNELVKDEKLLDELEISFVPREMAKRETELLQDVEIDF